MAKIFYKGHLALLGANVMWGLMAPVAKFVMAVGVVTPIVMTDMRIVGAMILFWIGSFFYPCQRVPFGDHLKLLVASLLGIVINQGCYIFGLGHTSPADASIIATSMPLWAMILAAFILKEPITLKKFGGIIVGATGALCLIMGSRSVSSHIGGDFASGNLFILGAQFSYALYLVLYKNFVQKYSLFTIMKWMFTYASIFILTFSMEDIRSVPWHEVTASQWYAVAFVVVCATFLSYIFILFGQKHLRPTVVGMYNYIQPVVACIVALCWGMDTFTVTKAVAIVFIFSGVYLVTTSRAANSDTSSCR